MESTGQKDFLKNLVQEWKNSGHTIGFVPTMGALHQGHLDLVRRARRECDRVVVSIFVNPLQFNNPEDLLKYPRHPEADARMLESENVDLLYSPQAADFYQIPSVTTLDFGIAGAGLEGAMRPGHFSGVGLVLARLFHLVQADKAYFGAKDLQQVAVVKTLVRDLEFPLEVVRCTTRREESGLAMSSRNMRLSPDGIQLAAQLHKALQLAMGNSKGHINPISSRSAALDYLQSFAGIEIEYLEWVDANSMQIWNEGPEPEEPAVCLAAWVEGVRLIDNLIAE